MTSQTWTVVGMTCQHCVASVTEEVSELTGVSHVVVDLASGELTVTSDGPLPDGAVADAVAEAGYTLT